MTNLPLLHDEIRSGLIDLISVAELQGLTEKMAAGDVADVIKIVPDAVAQDIVDNLSETDREQPEESLSHTENMVVRWLHS